VGGTGVFQSTGITTGPIYPNRDDNGDCSVAANAIKEELEVIGGPGFVTVTESSVVSDHSCDWTIEFTTLSGNYPEMKLISGSDGPSASVDNGFDTFSIVTDQDGTVDAIKAELERLTTIGVVTVTAGTPSADGECVWDIEFDTNPGDIPLLQFTKISGTGGGAVVLVTEGTSEKLGGDFTLEYDGQRTKYLPYDASAEEVEVALNALVTLGNVDVVRTGPYEDDGYTWTVTFKTDRGDLPTILVDTRALTGSIPIATVTEIVKGVAPPFNSLDPENGLSLGSATISDLSDLSLSVAVCDRVFLTTSKCPLRMPSVSVWRSTPRLHLKFLCRSHQTSRRPSNCKWLTAPPLK
jgi:hypothetical protein